MQSLTRPCATPPQQPAATCCGVPRPRHPCVPRLARQQQQPGQHARCCCVVDADAADASCSPHQTQPRPQQQQLGRRASLAAVLAAAAAAAAAAPVAQAASADVYEGTSNLARVGSESLRVWAAALLNDDQTGIISDLDDGLDGSSSTRRRFGSISVPGLSSFSFIHGALVGGAVILLLAADKLAPQQPQVQQHPALNPEVEAALKQLLLSPEVKQQFHDPAVHAALQEVRVDPRAIAKYRDDPVVMQAFSKLLEIENILERL